MTGKSVTAALAALMAAGAAEAAPKVAADIAPVHSLAAAVMRGVGEPALILPPGASPHGHAMRPSEAAAVESAEIVFWIGDALTPWLADALETLAPDARHVALLTAPGVRQLEFREGVTFEAHDHGGHDHGHESAKAEAHDDHGHDDEHAHDDQHAHDHDEGHDHAHDGLDPHAWLDPMNGAAMLDAIAAALAEADPANAAAYAANAEAAKSDLVALTDRLEDELAPLAGTPFVVFHDAYHHFEARFGLEAAGAVSLSDASEPGPRRLSEIREAIAGMDAACVFTEPQFPTGLAETAAEGTGARLGTLDPLGIALEPGPALYPALIESLAADLRACLAPQG